MIEFVLKLVDEVTGPAKEMSKRFTELGDKVTELHGRIAESEGGLLEAAGGIGALGTAALAGAGAVVGLGVAFAGLTAEGAHLALEAVGLKEKTLAAFSALAGGEEAGAATLKMVRELGRSVPQTEAELTQWAKTMLGAGVSADDLQKNLKAVAGAQALVGGGEKALSVITRLNEAGAKGSKVKFSTSMLAGTGVTEEELMKQLGMTPKQLELAKKQGTLTGKQLSDALVNVLATKGAGPVEAQTLELSAQWAKLKDNFMHLFEDVDVGPFLEAIKSLFSVFDQAKPSGQAMKSGITTALNGVFKILAMIIPKVRTFFLEMIVFGLKAYIAIKPLWTGFVAFWKAHNGSAILLTILKGLGIAIGVVVGAFAIMLGVGVAVAGMFSAIGVAVVAAVGLVIGLIPKAIGALADFGSAAIDAAKNFISGLVDGIKNGAGIVIDAVKNLGSSMLGGIKGILGIHSPSVEMMKLGKHAGGGFAAGVEAANDNVGAAAGGLSAAAAGGVASGVGGAPAPAPSSGGGGVTVTLEAGAIQINGASGSATDLTETAVTLMFERIALTQGLGVAA